MKQICIITLVVLCTAGLGYGKAKRNLSSESKNTITRLLARCAENNICAVRTTAYTHTEDDHIEFGNKTAIGTTLKYGDDLRSAASDWSIYPLGTRFKILGLPYTYVIDDYGIALVGKNTIDLYKPSKRAMNAWGARRVKVKILEWGSFTKSKRMMRTASKKYAFIKRMYDGIDKRFFGGVETGVVLDPVNKALEKKQSNFLLLAKAKAASRLNIALSDQDQSRLAGKKVAMAH